jgi:hypothetical protein
MLIRPSLNVKFWRDGMSSKKEKSTVLERRKPIESSSSLNLSHELTVNIVKYSLISTRTFLNWRPLWISSFHKRPVTPDCRPLILAVSLFFIPSPKTTHVTACEGENTLSLHSFFGRMSCWWWMVVSGDTSSVFFFWSQRIHQRNLHVFVNLCTWMNANWETTRKVLDSRNLLLSSRWWLNIRLGYRD